MNQVQQVSRHCTKHEGIHKPEPGGSKKVDRAIEILKYRVRVIRLAKQATEDKV